jgi:hypothetical protein
MWPERKIFMDSLQESFNFPHENGHLFIGASYPNNYVTLVIFFIVYCRLLLQTKIH